MSRKTFWSLYFAVTSSSGKTNLSTLSLDLRKIKIRIVILFWMSKIWKLLKNKHKIESKEGFVSLKTCFNLIMSILKSFYSSSKNVRYSTNFFSALEFGVKTNFHKITSFFSPRLFDAQRIFFPEGNFLWLQNKFGNQVKFKDPSFFGCKPLGIWWCSSVDLWSNFIR